MYNTFPSVTSVVATQSLARPCAKTVSNSCYYKKMLGYQVLTTGLKFLRLSNRCCAVDLAFSVHNVSVDGVHSFYRQAGCAVDPTVHLAHGSPDSSFRYRNLIPYLADAGYHVVASDYPGFGFTEVHASRNYTYDFDSFGRTIDLWLESINMTSFSMYLFDIGGPVGFYLALTNKYKIQPIMD